MKGKNRMLYIYVLTFVLLVISAAKSPEKTRQALAIALKKLKKIIPSFLKMVLLMSVILCIIPDSLIVRVLGSENGFLSVISASILGSVTLFPGFIAFPLAGMLKAKGATYMVLSALTTTIMMVGIVTFPLEKEYLGVKVAVIRNVMSFVVAIIVALVTGLLYGELV